MKTYNHKFPYKKIDENVIDYLTTLITNNPKLQVLVEIRNTRGISSEMLKRIPSNIDFRVAGGYDKTYLDNKNNGQEYYEAVIYSRNELYHIVSEMEKIESSLEPGWTKLEKAVAIYEKLKGFVQYDAKYESRPTSEIRTLRGLLSKQTVCAGYAIMYKELLNRQGIGCAYACGIVPGSGRHAWNLIRIDDKIYPIDLTWDSSAYQKGAFKKMEYFGQNDEEFRKHHVPDSWNQIQNYQKNLSSLDPNLVAIIRKKMQSQKEFSTSTHIATRKDGSKYLISQTGDAIIKGKNCYQYFYADLIEGKYVNPMLLYSGTNLQNVLTQLRFGKPVPKGLDVAIGNVLFSKENIEDSHSKKTNYLGVVYDNDEKKLITSVKDVPKDEVLCKALSQESKQFTRSDGSHFVLQKMLSKPYIVSGVKVMCYHAFEVVEEKGSIVVKKNILWTEQNLFKDTRQNFIDDFLSRSRLDRKMKEAGGYIGYYDLKGQRIYNPALVKAFENKSALDTRDVASVLGFPTFDELKSLALKYESVSIAPNQSWADTSLIRAKDRVTNTISEDLSLAKDVLLTDMWLSAAGIKWLFGNEERDGFSYAFNAGARELYNWLMPRIARSIETAGVIDTVKLYEDSKDLGYKYSQDIVERLFRMPLQVKFLNSYFQNRLKVTAIQTQNPEALLYYNGFSQDEDGLKR